MLAWLRSLFATPTHCRCCRAPLNGHGYTLACVGTFCGRCFGGIRRKP